MKHSSILISTRGFREEHIIRPSGRSLVNIQSSFSVHGKFASVFFLQKHRGKIKQKALRYGIAISIETK
jgi:hypothetical protein